MRVLGIDPGLATTGYALLMSHQGKKNVQLIEAGIIQTAPMLSLEKRLHELEGDLQRIIETGKPEVAAIEELFFKANITNGIPVAHARGVILLTLEKHGVPIVEFKPAQVKLALTGDGKADKVQIQKMLGLQLRLEQTLTPDDAADAAAIALTALFHQRG